MRTHGISLVILSFWAHGALAGIIPVGLGAAGSYAVLAGSTVTNTGNSIIIGNVGVSPGTSIIGFPPGTVSGGSIEPATFGQTATEAQAGLTTAYNTAVGESCTNPLTSDLGGLTLNPGVYCYSAAAGLTGMLTLNGQGNPNAVFVFQIGSALTTAGNSSIVLENGAQARDVFWQVGSSATLGGGTQFEGDILASASITLDGGAILTGAALARGGAVTLIDNDVSIPANLAETPEPSPFPIAAMILCVLVGRSTNFRRMMSRARLGPRYDKSGLKD